jgi:hypothetical protein
MDFILALLIGISTIGCILILIAIFASFFSRSRKGDLPPTQNAEPSVYYEETPIQENSSHSDTIKKKMKKNVSKKSKKKKTLYKGKSKR